jgi:two-component system nitrate/nitrite response regulator NarL
MAIHVLLVTDVRLYAEGIATGLPEDPAIAAVAVAPDCAAALGKLRREPADVAILDLAAIDDVPQARAFAVAARPARVVALAVRDSDREVIAWAEHGVTGILTREATFEQLRQAVLAAARDECD